MSLKSKRLNSCTSVGYGSGLFNFVHAVSHPNFVHNFDIPKYSINFIEKFFFIIVVSILFLECKLFLVLFLIYPIFYNPESHFGFDSCFYPINFI